ncbi:unnamed protein product [Sphenostylis stenocarpa]|uniref:Uncharacterized protein n=1 Tax=Sphenostylis stenocarpa TaxID=92480 RepID=A0AA86ST26_9FABA|nr:unnamed protein product [Sphenostylis stenocarpa]
MDIIGLAPVPNQMGHFAVFGRRGWSETANTWEALENLQSVPDLLYAFEDSLSFITPKSRSTPNILPLLTTLDIFQLTTPILKHPSFIRKPVAVKIISKAKLHLRISTSLSYGYMAFLNLPGSTMWGLGQSMKPCPTNSKDLEYRSSCRYDMWGIDRPISGRISRNFEIWGCGIIRFKACCLDIKIGVVEREVYLNVKGWSFCVLCSAFLQSNPILIYLKCKKGAVSSYIHPFINKKLLQICDGLPAENVTCEDLSSTNSGASAINFWEKTNIGAECALCGATASAFRKSSDGQCVHALCSIH